jgi:hypothetical protein
MQMDKVPDLLQWFKERGIEYEGVRVISDRYFKTNYIAFFTGADFSERIVSCRLHLSTATCRVLFSGLCRVRY